uniref:G-patch domain-containing protein n=1 Tax=Hyaloperonospora arabidopsidis (strain Emoy2) TaxID=559515 RepID=M4BEC1_HYAAE
MGKNFRHQLGAMANESASIGVSAFARLQMEKMGWSVGKGLGKHEQGVQSHVKVKRRKELQGVGAEKKEVREEHKQWWYNVYDSVASKIVVNDELSAADGTDEAKKRLKKARRLEKRLSGSKRIEGQEQVHYKARIPTAEELFAATGGKLFGRRAYGSCSGKLKRNELQLQKIEAQESQDMETIRTLSTKMMEEENMDRRRKKAKKSEVEGLKETKTVKKKKKHKRKEKKRAGSDDSV